MTPIEIDRLLRPLQLKELRLLCRERGLNPAGGKEQLDDRLKQFMLSTGNYTIQVSSEGHEAVPVGYAVAPQGYQQYTTGGGNNNNYGRPGGQQNVGGYPELQPTGQYQQAASMQQAPYGSPMQNQQAYGTASNDTRNGSLTNNYSRPGGHQNVGNFITDRPSSRVLAPPGGASQISFGDYNLPSSAQHNAQYRSPMPPPYAVAQVQQQQGYGYGSPAMGAVGHDGRSSAAGAMSAEGGQDRNANNYSRPGGQNVGNFITDRPSSKVLAPPGGKSQITFG